MTLNITILGLDALGASLGMALGTLDAKALDVGRPRITGWDSNKKLLEVARSRLSIDQAAPDLALALRDADVIFVNVPPDALEATLTAIVPHLKHGAVVTDTSSVKAPVLALVKRLLPTTVQFVGGHPFVAISGGPERGQLDLFRDVMYCLVPGSNTGQGALDGMTELISAIGAKPYYIDADEHDSYAAAAAHLPVVSAVALMAAVSASPGWREIVPIAGEGLVTTTTLVDGDPAGTAAVLHANRTALNQWLNALEDSLEELRGALERPAELQALLERSIAARNSWLASRPNVRPGEDAMYSNVQGVQPNPLTGMFFGRRTPKNKK